MTKCSLFSATGINPFQLKSGITNSNADKTPIITIHIEIIKIINLIFIYSFVA